MTPDRAEWQAIAQEAGLDPDAAAARRQVCVALATTLTKAGDSLWVIGSIFGGDRVSGASPFQFGSDAVVGLATVTQIGGELCSGIISLLDLDNRYAAMALLRQLVEVEYLAWAFAEDNEEAANWLRSDKEARRRMWQPRHLRERSGDRFRGKDYQMHCELGGHPTPEGRPLLPDHERMSSFWWWYELAVHGVSVWEYVTAASALADYSTHTNSAAEECGLDDKIKCWRDTDRLKDITIGASHLAEAERIAGEQPDSWSADRSGSHGPVRHRVSPLVAVKVVRLVRRSTLTAPSLATMPARKRPSRGVPSGADCAGE